MAIVVRILNLILKKMKDHFSFIAIMAVFVLAYGITTHGMYIYSNSASSSSSGNRGSIVLAKLASVFSGTF